MATAAQIAANRTNAQNSTGPSTPEGLANCKFNATKHGLTGKQIVTKDENPADYDALRLSLIADYQPATETEAMLVEEIAQNYWRLQRARRMETEVIKKYGEIECLTDPDGCRAFQQVGRYLNTIHRSWSKAVRDIEKLQTTRKQDQAALDLARHCFSTPRVSRPEPEIGSVSQNSPCASEDTAASPVSPAETAADTRSRAA